MAKKATIAICLACLSGSAAFAQDFSGAAVYPGGGNGYVGGAPNGYVGGAPNGYGGSAPNEYVGGASIGSTEPLYPYDDQEEVEARLDSGDAVLPRVSLLPSV